MAGSHGSARVVKELFAAVRVLGRWWWLVVIPILFSLLSALPSLPAMNRTTSGYATTLHFSAAQQPPEQMLAESSIMDLWLTAELAVHAISTWVRTESFRNELGGAPGLQDGDLDALGIASDSHRSIGQLFLSHPDAQALQRIAAAAIDVLLSRSGDYFPQFDEGTVSVTVLDAASVGPVPVPLSRRLTPLIRIALGIGVGLVLAVLAHSLDPYLRSRSDVEALGLAVLVSLPKD